MTAKGTDPENLVKYLVNCDGCRSAGASPSEVSIHGVVDRPPSLTHLSFAFLALLNIFTLLSKLASATNASTALGFRWGRIPPP